MGHFGSTYSDRYNGGDNMAHFEIKDLSFSYPTANGKLALKI